MSADASRLSRLVDTAWNRHANPKSGWSRLLIGPLLLAGLYRRDRRLVVLAVVAAVVNPVLFAPPDGDEDSWMTRAVRAEEWWLDGGHGAFGVGWPNVLNTLNVPTFGYAVYAAVTRKPIRATATYVLSMALKLGWIELIARRYDARSSR